MALENEEVGPLPPSHQLWNNEVSRETGTFCVQPNANRLPEEKELLVACALFTRKWIDIGFGKPMSVELVVSMRISGNYPSNAA